MVNFEAKLTITVVFVCSFQLSIKAAVLKQKFWTVWYCLLPMQIYGIGLARRVHVWLNVTKKLDFKESQIMK